MSFPGYSYRYAAIAALDLPAPGLWLAAGERGELARLRDPGRRNAWLAGRWLAKRLLSERLNFRLEPEELGAIEICSRQDGKLVRPQANAEGIHGDWRLSIAHTERGVLVAVAPVEIAIGVDLVQERERPAPGFDQVWFTSDEQDWIASGPRRRRLALWAAKEAVYKALNCGEPFRPHDWLLAPQPDGGLAIRNKKHSGLCRLTLWRTPQSEIAVLATNGTPQRALPAEAPLLGPAGA
jgi:4'-phosphopantetheinyl transferase